MLIFHNNAPNESHFVLILKAYFSLELITAQTHYFIFSNYSFCSVLYCCISYDTAVERYKQKLNYCYHSIEEIILADSTILIIFVRDLYKLKLSINTVP